MRGLFLSALSLIVGGSVAASGAHAFEATLGSAITTGLMTQDDFKQAIVDAQEPAAVVLDGGQASDLFLAGKTAAERALALRFESDPEAAIAILEIARRFE